uniref:START domain-containing protein n=1 Tax=Panagrellus redivivus TaxID=6233 RepID=A0A7E5A1Y5_PANRE
MTHDYNRHMNTASCCTLNVASHPRKENVRERCCCCFYSSASRFSRPDRPVTLSNLASDLPFHVDIEPINLTMNRAYLLAAFAELDRQDHWNKVYNELTTETEAQIQLMRPVSHFGNSPENHIKTERHFTLYYLQTMLIEFNFVTWLPISPTTSMPAI